jgi:hypothetical protein
MEWLKKNWTLIAAIVLAGLLLKQCNVEPEYIEVPINIEVEVPVVEVQFDTVYLPTPIKRGKKQIDSTYIKKWEELKNDSIAKDSLFRKAIEINDYRETVEDDTITINLGMKVRGELLQYNVDYKTKPRTISLDTVLKVEIPKNPLLYFGADAIIPNNNPSLTPSIAPGILFISKNHKHAYKINYDVMNKGITVGAYWKF